ncbi:MAG: Rap1a/Tai family immunity protein [Pseudomonadota bacterium]
MKVIIAMLAVVGLAFGGALAASDPVFKVPSNPDQSLTSTNLNLSTERFLRAYFAEDLEQRRFAEMYLAGILDASEGVQWCSYSRALPHILEEMAISSLQEAMQKRPQDRAARAIVSKIQSTFPCER